MEESCSLSYKKRAAPFSPSSADEDGDYTEVISKNTKRLRQAQGLDSSEALSAPGTSAPGTKGRAKKCAPLVLEGLDTNDLNKANYRLDQMLNVSGGTINRIKRSKSGKILIFPSDTNSRQQLLEAHNGKHLKVREAKERRPGMRPSNTVVLTGVHPDTDVERIAGLIGLPCKRILSAARGATHVES
jgi:hypothetical protein